MGLAHFFLDLNFICVNLLKCEATFELSGDRHGDFMSNNRRIYISTFKDAGQQCCMQWAEFIGLYAVRHTTKASAYTQPAKYQTQLVRVEDLQNATHLISVD